MKTFQKLVELGTPVSIKKMLHQRVAKTQPARTMGKYIYASALTGPKYEFCPRMYALQKILDKKEPGDFISTSLKVTFDHGWDIQDRINNHYLKDVMFGDWKCTSCGERRKKCTKPQGKCNKSGITCNWSYREVGLLNDEYGVAGSPDGLVDVSQEK